MTSRREDRGVLVGIYVAGDAVGLTETLETVQPAMGDGAELILVPDEPAGKRPQPLRRSLLRPVSRLGGPGGRPGAFNRVGARAAETDRTVVFIEAGSRPAPEALARLVAAVRRPGVGLAGPSMNDAWNEQRPRLVDAAVPGPSNLVDIERSLTAKYGDKVRSLAPLYSIVETCIAVAAETLDRVGAADEGFGAGPCWEMEYAARAASAGLDTVWVPAAYVHNEVRTAERHREVALHFDSARHRYQDRVCGLRLSGASTRYAEHCNGAECDNFAPAERIVVHLPLPAVRGPDDGRSRPSRSTLTAWAAGGERARLASCIMPTADRPEWVAKSIEFFHRQDHQPRELVIVDDGSEDLRGHIADLLDHPSITHVRLDRRLSIGAKRNIGIERARGRFILQWDDDDWYGPRRISRQIAPIEAGTADVTGFDDAIWFDVERWRFRRPNPETHRTIFVENVHGGTLAYDRAVWECRGIRYPNASLAEDAAFVRSAVASGCRLMRLPGGGDYLYIRHATNSWQLAPQYQGADAWDEMSEPVALGADRSFYAALSRRAPMLASPLSPMVTCIMPTADRAHFLPEAIESFRSQRFSNAELLILDDGIESASHLIPDDPRIRYVRIDHHVALGTKRNQSIEHARGEIVVHMDDDDWSHPDRLGIQVQAIEAGADMCGLDRSLWWNPTTGEAWRYVCPDLPRPWVAGNTLAYLRSTWARGPFPAQDVGEDTAFVWGLPDRRVVPIDDERLVVGRLHDSNTSTKHTHSAVWTPVDIAVVENIMAGSTAEPSPVAAIG